MSEPRRLLSDEEALEIIGRQSRKSRALREVEYSMRMWIMERSDLDKLKVGTARSIAREAMRLAARALHDTEVEVELGDEGEAGC